MLLFQLTVKIFHTIILFIMLMPPAFYFCLTLHQIIKHVNIFTKKTAMFIILPEVIPFLFLFKISPILFFQICFLEQELLQLPQQILLFIAVLKTFRFLVQIFLIKMEKLTQKVLILMFFIIKMKIS